MKNASPDIIEEIRFAETLADYTALGRLFEINIMLTPNAQAATGYIRFQITFQKTSVVLYGQKPDYSWETFGTIT